MAASLPGFLFDVEKWFGSVSTQRMSFAEKGVYLVMMFQQWRDAAKSLPDDGSVVADLIAVTDSQRAEVLAAWETVRRKFVADRRTPGRIFNARLEHTRRVQRAYQIKRAEAGRAGGAASGRTRKAVAGKRLDDKADTAKQSFTVVNDAEAIVNDSKGSDLSRLDQSRSDLSREDQIGEEEHVPRASALDVRFDAFWAAYPRKVGKAAARRCWQKARPNEEQTAVILAAIAQQKTWAQWLKAGGDFIPHPSTWLHEGRWQDEARSASPQLVSDITQQNMVNAEIAIQRIKERDEHPR